MSKVLNPLTDYILFALLILFTPYVMLSNYLQSVVGLFSQSSFSLFGMDIPVVLTTYILFLLSLTIIYFHRMKRIHLIGIVFAATLYIISYKISDYYLDVSFYSLQQNWHYVTYGIYTLLLYRWLKTKEIDLYKVFMLTASSTLLLSTLDETLQFFTVDRVFDIHDIAKDLWGCSIGLTLIFFIFENKKIQKSEKLLDPRSVKEFLKNPMACLLILLIFASVFLIISSLLSENKYFYLAISLTMLFSLSIVICLYLLRFKRFKLILISMMTLLFVIQSFYFIRHRSDNFTYAKKYLKVFKGIPIAFFDFLIFPDGSFRLVDKKEHFFKTDMKTMMKSNPDILLVGSGSYGQGGKGFPEERPVQFIFNENKGQMVQVITQKTSEAITTYKRLIKEGKKVVCVIHNN